LCRHFIPGLEDQFNLKVTPPFGEEKVIVCASETPIGDIALQDIGHGLGSFRGGELFCYEPWLRKAPDENQ